MTEHRGDRPTPGRHRAFEHRQASLAAILDDDAALAVAGLATIDLERRLAASPSDVPLAVFDLLVEVYGRAVLCWAGTGVSGTSSPRISHELALSVDGGDSRTAYLRSSAARWRLHHWATGLVRAARRPHVLGDGDGRTPLERVAGQRDDDGRPVPAGLAATELLDLLRPAVAAAYLGSFAVLALADHPETRARLADPAAEAERIAFVREVLRVFPVAPARLGARRGAARGQARAAERLTIALLAGTVRVVSALHRRPRPEDNAAEHPAAEVPPDRPPLHVVDFAANRAWLPGPGVCTTP